MTKSSDKSEKAGITAADFMAEARALTLEGMRKRAASNRPSALDRLNELLGQEPTIGKDEARRVTQPQPVAPAETIPMQPMKPAPLSPDEAIAAALAKSEAKKEWLAAAVAECEARDAKLSALPPDDANVARKLMGLPLRSNAPKPLTPVRGVSTPIPPRTPASAAPEPASAPIEETAAPMPAPGASAPAVSLAEPVRFADLPRVMAEAMHADPMARAGARINLGMELTEMVTSGRLKVRDALTHGPHPYPVGDALKNAVLLPQEVRQLLAERGFSAPALPVPAPAPASSARPPAVATPEPVAPPADAVPQVAAWMFTQSEREKGYGADLNALLERWHKSGKPIPTAADVIEIWKANPPRIFRVVGGNLEYRSGSSGAWKMVQEKSLNEAIKKRTSA